MSPPIKPFTSLEVTELIHRLNTRKAPGHDQRSNKAIKEIPVKGIALISLIFNAIFPLEYYSKTWKTSLITLIPKPGKPIHETSSYRPISPLPTVSKLFENLLMNRLFPLLEDLKTLPDHQFGFRKQHSTIEKIHRIAHNISQSLEKKKYCSAVFLDIQQALTFTGKAAKEIAESVINTSEHFKEKIRVRKNFANAKILFAIVVCSGSLR